jgi:hypothetical protein
VEHFAKALIIIAVLAFFALLPWLASRDAPGRRRLAFEAQKLLLDKFQSPEELTRFLSSEAGKLFVEGLGGNGGARALNANPLWGIIALIVSGAVGIALGLTFLMLAKFNEQPDMLAPAIVVSIPSLGLLIGAAVSYHLKKKWGLLKREPATPEA